MKDSRPSSAGGWSWGLGGARGDEPFLMTSAPALAVPSIGFREVHVHLLTKTELRNQKATVSILRAGDEVLGDSRLFWDASPSEGLGPVCDRCGS